MNAAHAEKIVMAGVPIDPFVQDVGICVLVAGILAALFERVKIPAIAALLVAGVAIGPVGLSLVTDKARIETIAHLGLTLLLFVIGLEVNVRSLLASGRTIVVIGTLQVPICFGVGWAMFAAAGAMGVLPDTSGYVPLYLGLACAFSSTLLVVGLLQSSFQLDAPSGRLSVAVLVFQDVWAIIVLAMLPNLAAPNLGPVAATFGGMAVVTVAAVVVGRWVLPGAFRRVATIPELVVLVALAWCFGLGLFGVNIGRLLHLVGVDLDVSVSLEMGALIAGASIASLPYSHEVVTKVVNLRDFFVTLFFVALGMGVPVPDGAILGVGVLLAVVALALRALLFLPLFFVAGTDRRTAVMTSARLAQVSEFCLVIVYLGASLGHVSAKIVASVIYAFVLTAVLTPYLFGASHTLDTRVGPLLARLGMKPPAEAPTDKRPVGARVALLGFHRLASSLLHDLAAADPEIVSRILVVDLNVDLHDKLRERGVRVVYGDISNAGTLRHAHVDAADVIISTVPDDILKGTTNVQLARMVRKIAPKSKIVVNATRLADARKMYEAGADYVFSWRTETAFGLMPALKALLEGRVEELHAERRASGRDLRDLAERREIVD